MLLIHVYGTEINFIESLYFCFQRKKTDVMVAENKVNRRAEFVDSAAQMSFKNAKKVNKILKVCLNWFKNLGEVETSIYEHLTTDHRCIKALISSH